MTGPKASNEKLMRDHFSNSICRVIRHPQPVLAYTLKAFRSTHRLLNKYQFHRPPYRPQ